MIIVVVIVITIVINNIDNIDHDNTNSNSKNKSSNSSTTSLLPEAVIPQGAKIRAGKGSSRRASLESEDRIQYDIIQYNSLV